MVVLGRITAPHGIRGWVRMHPFGDDPLAWRQIPAWWLSPEADAPQEAWRPVDVIELRPHGTTWIAKLGHCNDRSAAELLAGQYVGCPRETLPQTAADEYYWEDLVGLQVCNLQGEELGRIDRLAETGANAVLYVMDGEHERLLPFVAAVVRKVDVANGRLVVDWGSDW